MTISDYGIANGSQDSWPFMTKGNGVRTVKFPSPHDTPGARTFVYRAPVYTYKVAPGDTLASVARKLFGANSRHYRNILRNQGFDVGTVISYNDDGAKRRGDSEEG